MRRTNRQDTSPAILFSFLGGAAVYRCDNWLDDRRLYLRMLSIQAPISVAALSFAEKLDSVLVFGWRSGLPLR